MVSLNTPNCKTTILTRFDGCIGRSDVRRTGRWATRIENDVSIGQKERETKQEKQKQTTTKEKKTKNREREKMKVESRTNYYSGELLFTNGPTVLLHGFLLYVPVHPPGVPVLPVKYSGTGN